MSNPAIYEGGCHCGAVRFRVKVDKHQATICNCSICTKKGFIHLIVPASDFSLLQGEEALTTYTFNTGTAKHTFCQTCGIHSFYRPRSHPEGYSVNIRCLDSNVIDQFEVIRFDGRNWEKNIENFHSEVP